jgi:hypothetical protein
MRRMMALAAVALVTSVGFVACSDDEDEFTEENLSEQLVEQGLFEEEEADCVADSVFNELNEDELADVEDSFDSEGDLPPALQDALTTAVTECVDLGG